jgi:hypothetical protein
MTALHASLVTQDSSIVPYSGPRFDRRVLTTFIARPSSCRGRITTSEPIVVTRAPLPDRSCIDAGLAYRITRRHPLAVASETANQIRAGLKTPQLASHRTPPQPANFAWCFYVPAQGHELYSQKTFQFCNAAKDSAKKAMLPASNRLETLFP